MARSTLKRKSEAESGPDRPKRARHGCISQSNPDTTVEDDPTSALGDESVDVTMAFVSPEEQENEDPDSGLSGYTSISLQGSALDGDASETQSEFRQRADDERGPTLTASPSLHRKEDTELLKAAASELRNLVTNLQGEHAELGKKFNTYLDTVTLRVMDKISSLEYAVNQRFEEQLLQFRCLEPTSADRGQDGFKSAVKSHATKLLYPRDTGPLAPLKLNIPVAAEVLDFGKGSHIGPTIGNFRVDPTSAPSSAWNLRACQVFAQDFFAARYPEAEGKTVMDVSYEFYQLVPDFISHHATASGFADVPSYQGFHESLTKHLRRHRLGESRLKTVNEVQELREFLPIVRQLAEDDGMSSDERDTDDARYFHSSRPFWRHACVTDWLHSLDSVGTQISNNVVQHEDRRRRSSKVDMESRVVKGLPVNFYDWSYLSGLDRSQYLGLDPKPALPLTLSTPIQQILSRGRGGGLTCNSD